MTTSPLLNGNSASGLPMVPADHGDQCLSPLAGEGRYPPSPQVFRRRVRFRRDVPTAPAPASLQAQEDDDDNSRSIISCGFPCPQHFEKNQEMVQRDMAVGSLLNENERVTEPHPLDQRNGKVKLSKIANNGQQKPHGRSMGQSRTK